MFEPTTWHRIGCDAPGCIRRVQDHAVQPPLLMHTLDLDAVPAATLTQAARAMTGTVAVAV